mmetsp:Transcript_11866/g.19580  ORF Transcript_11866/g.19580 Transcript_11866/m.19580 type:complete len:312 (-) Transcript_11866:1918-2853(-)
MGKTSKWNPAHDALVIELVERLLKAQGKKSKFEVIANHLNENNLLPFEVNGKEVGSRYRIINPSVIRGVFTQFEIAVVIKMLTLLDKPNDFAFIGSVLMRPAQDMNNAWNNYIKKSLAAKLKALTGRNDLKVGEKYYFGTEAQMTECVKAAWDYYSKKHSNQSNDDSRIHTRATLPMERIVSLAEAQNEKIAKVAARAAKGKARKATQDGRAAKRNKNEEGVLALLKNDEEVDLLEKQQPNSEWVKAKNTAHKAILSAGHSEEDIAKLLKLARATIEKNPLGRSTSDSNKSSTLKRQKELRNILADSTNTK